MRREAASASELAEAMKGFEGYCVPSIDWDRTNGRVMTIEWVDGIKISDVAALKAAGHDLPQLASRLVLAFLTQAISAGFFHADMHQGNLFVRPDGTIVAIDFGIMGRIDRRARQWLAEILYGLTTGNYRRVAEIHFEAQYVPSYHSVDEFATALRAVGEPMRGKPVSELSVGHDARRAVRDHPRFRHADPAAPAAAAEDHGHGRGHRHACSIPRSTCGTSRRLTCSSWIRDELGPEAALADRIREDVEHAAAPARADPPHRGPLSRRAAARPSSRRCPRSSWCGSGRRAARRWPGYLAAALAGGGAGLGRRPWLGWLG